MTINTERSDKIVEMYQAGSTQVQIATELNLAQSTVSSHLNKARRAAQRGNVEPGYMMRGESRLVGPDGEVKLRWLKSQEDRETVEELLLEVAQGLKDDLPRYEPVAELDIRRHSNLLNLFILTDFHLGQLSWAEETGDNWDLMIAEDTMVKWFKAAIMSAPPSDTGILCNLGDFLHFDGLEAITPTGKNLLDSDTRFQKLVRTAIRVMRRVITMMLERHKHVRVIMAEGNHDMASSVWLRELFNSVYQDEPRVIIDDTAKPFYAYQHGQTALFFHHGHTVGIKRISQVFAGMYREIFGATQHAYAHLGHYHHKKVEEDSLMTIEQHRTLAGKDAYAIRHGWLADREASVITYHKEYGEVSRVSICPDMLR